MKLFFQMLVCGFLIADCASTPVAQSPTSKSSTPLPTFIEDENGSAYLAWDIGNSNSSDYPEFWEEYDLAIKKGENWAQDPLEVAVHFLHPSTVIAEPACLKEEVAYLPTSEESQAIFIFLYSVCADDSLGKIKLRIELSQQDKIWKIDWFGGMKKCKRGSAELRETWHTKICS